MKFQPGNNLGGRKKGSKNRIKKTLRDTISAFLNENFYMVECAFEELSPRDQVKLYCDLLQFGLPKLQSMNIDNKIEKLPDEQIDELINKIFENNEQ